MKKLLNPEPGETIEMGEKGFDISFMKYFDSIGMLQFKYMDQSETCIGTHYLSAIVKGNGRERLVQLKFEIIGTNMEMFNQEEVD